MQNADNILFRCSALGHIMADGKESLTEKQKETLAAFLLRSDLTEKQIAERERLIKKRDNPELADGVKTHLADVFVSNVYGRNTEKKNKFVEKGNIVEEDSLTAYSLYKNTFYRKNTTLYSNAWIMGTPDVHKPPLPVIDTKSSWDIFTFWRAKEKLNKLYEWQGIGYMDLTGADKFILAYCLVNTPAHLIDSEKRKAQFYLGLPDGHADLIDEFKRIEKNSIYDMPMFLKQNPYYQPVHELSEWHFDIPLEERVFEIEFTRDENKIKKMHERVEQCREYMNKNLFKLNRQGA